MANRLQKKLQEVETKLGNIIRVPMEVSSPNPRHQAAFDDISKGFVFLNNLLIQEIATQPPENAEKLHKNVGGRINALKAAFRGWNQHRMSFCESSSHYPEDVAAPEKKEGVAAGWDDVRGRRRNYAAVFGCGMIAGAVCMLLLFFVSYHYLNECHHLYPPT